VDEMAGAFGMNTGGEEKCIKSLVEKPERRISHESPSHRRGDNIKVDLKGM